MSGPHVLVIPYPAQGHVIPLMELSLSLIKHGFRITFVNTHFIHHKILEASLEKDDMGDQLRLVSIPDGLECDDDRAKPWKLTEAMWQVMPGKLEEIIEDINGSSGNEITCVVADKSIGWAITVAAKKGIRVAAFSSAPAMVSVLGFSIPKLINDGIINTHGTPIKKEMIQLSPTIPAVDPKNLIWARLGDLTLQKSALESSLKNNEAMKLVDWLIFNSAYNLEPSVFDFAPEMKPIGPLLTSNRLRNSVGNLWPQESTCLKWLDEQLPYSVIYVAFGSTTIFSHAQFQELALGLELTNRPFLWVVRENTMDNVHDAYPEGFQDRAINRGKIVGWAPQQKVLNHPSVGCFLSHCGWNSTMEGVSSGVPFLCWPYFADQFLNKSYVCDVWQIGLGLNPDGRGIITREEIKTKVDRLLGDREFKARALNLKEMVMDSVKEGGSSYNNFQKFIDWIRG